MFHGFTLGGLITELCLEGLLHDFMNNLILKCRLKKSCKDFSAACAIAHSFKDSVVWNNKSLWERDSFSFIQEFACRGSTLTCLFALSVCTRREVDCKMFVYIVSMYKKGGGLQLGCLHCQYVQEGRWIVTWLFTLSVCTRREVDCNLVVYIVSKYKKGGGL